MRISIMFGSDALGILRPPGEVAEEAVAAERDGFPSAWCTHITRGIDSLTTLAVAARATSQIELGVGVVPSYRAIPWRWPSRPQRSRRWPAGGSCSGWVSPTVR